MKLYGPDGKLMLEKPFSEFLAFPDMEAYDPSNCVIRLLERDVTNTRFNPY